MKRVFTLLAVGAFLVTALSAADWLMFGADQQRTGWARNEKILNKETAKNLGLKWKVKLVNETRSLTALTAPVVATGVETEGGNKDIVYVAGSADYFYAIDAADGSIVWEKKFKTEVTATREGMWLCPKGVNATPLIDRQRNLIYAIAIDGKLYAMDLATGKEKWRAMQFVNAFAKAWSLNVIGNTLYTSISQNCGDTPSGIASIDLDDPVNYTIKVWRAAGYAAGVWGRGGPLIGRDGWIYGSSGDGNFDPAENDYGQTTFALDPETLKLHDYYTPENWDYVRKRDFDIGTSPVAFIYKNKEYLAVGGKEGLVYLIEGANPDGPIMGGPGHMKNIYTTPLLSNDEEWFEARGVWGNLSFYRDDDDRHWVYVPLWGPLSTKSPKYENTNGPNPNGSVAAFTMEEDGAGKPYLKARWVSGDFNVPEPVVIANGVVFALSNGENARQTDKAGIFKRGNFTLLKDTQRLESANVAQLRALDAQTGETLYDSGPGIFENWAHFSGLGLANGQVYAVDFSSTLYCFGVK